MTTTEHDELAARLAALADEPAPPASFDIATSIARGRAHRHRRYRATAGAVAVVAAAALTATALLRPGGAGTPTAPAVETLPTATSTPTATATPASTPTAAQAAAADPVNTEIAFGWLPDWAGEPGRIDREGQDEGSYFAHKDSGRNDPRLNLQLYPVGVEPPMESRLLPSGVDLVREDAPPIDGRTAYWTTLSSGSVTWSLRWLTPSGRWAEVTANNGTPEQTGREVLRKVAENVRYGHRDVPLPVQFTDLPQEFGTPHVQLSRPDPGGRGAWNLFMSFKVEGKAVTLELRPDTKEPGTMPTGHPTPSPTCATQNGVWICANAFGGVPSALEQIGGLSGLLSRTEAIGVDENTWTTNVFVP